jgi:hypothetical protein
MTINAEVFPVGTVSGVVPVIPVLMMHGKKMSAFEIELSPTFGADQSVDLQGLFPVIGGGRIFLQLPDDFSRGFVSRGLARLRSSEFDAWSASQETHLP